ncbi:MAG TPA: pyridoxamine 5'-phosphate oxidase family protein [Candidatus Limnocylindrales bacterium]|nr:pyridoxamine 5'-phosphate oxidase family protein [Candidatus Limnocylindrales bacterium]
MSADPRTRPQRRRDTEHRLANDVDVWVASASADGAPYLVPLSFDWDGDALLVATPTDSPTGRNLAATRTVRLGLGDTRDVSMIDGDVEALEIDALPQQVGDRFAARAGFDPRVLATPYRWFRISPRRIQAWREVNELPDRELMRDGRWLPDAPAGRAAAPGLGGSAGRSEGEPEILFEAGQIEPGGVDGDREGGPA